MKSPGFRVALTPWLSLYIRQGKRMVGRQEAEAEVEADARGPSHLESEPCDEHVPAHGFILVHKAGALMTTLVLPQQTGLVNHPAKGYGPRNTACQRREFT